MPFEFVGVVSIRPLQAVVGAPERIGAQNRWMYIFLIDDLPRIIYAPHLESTKRLQGLPVHNIDACIVQPSHDGIDFRFFHPNVVPREIVERRAFLLEHERHAARGLDIGADSVTQGFWFVIPAGHLMPPMVHFKQAIMRERNRAPTPLRCDLLCK